MLPFLKFWEHVSAHYGNLLSYSIACIPIRLSLLVLADTSCNERGIAACNRIHIASRLNVEVTNARGLITIKHYGPKSVHEFNAEDMYERYLRVISEGNGASSNAKCRNLVVLLRRIMCEAKRFF